MRRWKDALILVGRCRRDGIRFRNEEEVILGLQGKRREFT
jgi:hypothetical protein